MTNVKLKFIGRLSFVIFMKHIATFFITIYQLFVSPLLKTMLGVNRMCRFTPSCSEYMKTNIEKYGIIRGGYLGIVRLLHCQPFSKHTYSKRTTNPL